MSGSCLPLSFTFPHSPTSPPDTQASSLLSFFNHTPLHVLYSPFPAQGAWFSLPHISCLHPNTIFMKREVFPDCRCNTPGSHDLFPYSLSTSKAIVFIFLRHKICLPVYCLYHSHCVSSMLKKVPGREHLFNKYMQVN